MKSSTGVLTIDLSSIQANWKLVRSNLNATTECAAVVKANAYGVGAIPVAKVLYDAGCRHFYLATFDEASELRDSLPIDVALYVLGGVKSGSEIYFSQKNIIPVLYSSELIKQWESYCLSINQPLPCVIKIDTGMSRLGLSQEEFNQFVQKIPSFSHLNPVLLMSHLACADEVAHPCNETQLENFHTAISRVKNYFPHMKFSLANSSGTFLGKGYHFDMVRIGAALYGINPQPTKANPLRNVINLKLPVLQLRTTTGSASVGYGAGESVDANTRLAVVAGGYADGLHRTLGMKPRGRIDNLVVEAIGRVSMDSCVFNITHSENKKPQFIQVIDDYLTLDVLMENNKSLGYEVLTSLGSRFNRQYIFSADNL